MRSDSGKSHVPDVPGNVCEYLGGLWLYRDLLCFVKKTVYQRRNTRPITHFLARESCVFISSFELLWWKASVMQSAAIQIYMCPHIIHLGSSHLPSQAQLSTHLSIHPFISLVLLWSPATYNQPVLKGKSFISITHSPLSSIPSQKCFA